MCGSGSIGYHRCLCVCVCVLLPSFITNDGNNTGENRIPQTEQRRGTEGLKEEDRKTKENKRRQ